MSEFTAHVVDVVLSHQSFRDKAPVFDVLSIGLIGKNANDLVQIFFHDEEYAKRLARAVAAFNKAWELKETLG